MNAKSVLALQDFAHRQENAWNRTLLLHDRPAVRSFETHRGTHDTRGDDPGFDAQEVTIECEEWWKRVLQGAFRGREFELFSYQWPVGVWNLSVLWEGGPSRRFVAEAIEAAQFGTDVRVSLARWPDETDYYWLEDSLRRSWNGFELPVDRGLAGFPMLPGFFRNLPFHGGVLNDALYAWFDANADAASAPPFPLPTRADADAWQQSPYPHDREVGLRVAGLLP